MSIIEIIILTILIFIIFAMLFATLFVYKAYKLRKQEVKNLVISQNPYNGITLPRQIINSAIIGNELETWCKNQYENEFQNFDDVSYDKATSNKFDSKPDYIFTIYTSTKNKNEHTKIASIVLEMKTTGGSNLKNKNKDHFEKLKKDTYNFQGEFGILVTELEPEDHFIIRKIQNYKNLFMVRPQYLIYFLTMFRAIYKSCDSLVARIESNTNIDSNTIGEVITSIKNFKEELVQDSFVHINKKLLEIQEATKTINNSVNKINSALNTLQSSYITKLKEKVESFVKKIE